MLREIPLFATLNPEELEELLKQLEKEIFPPHTVIMWMDEPGDKLYLIEEGEVRISFINKEGKEITLGMQGAGTFLGELSLLDGGPHTATVRTTATSTVWSVGRATFYSYLDKHPNFSRTLLAVLVDRLRKNIVNMHPHTAELYTPPYQPATFRKFLDNSAKFVSSSRFLIWAVIFLSGWIILQTWYYKFNHGVISFADEPPTFFFLGFILTLSSFLFTILVLTSQRGLAEQDRIRAEIEYQVNLKAQSEIMRLQLKMDEVLKMLEEKKRSAAD